MSIQTSRIRKVEVGTPPSSMSNDNEWEIIQIRYHDFENLTTIRNEYVISPEFTCFGHTWCLKLYPGGAVDSTDGKVGIFLFNMSNKSITLQYGFTVRDKGRKVGKDFLSEEEGTAFAPFGTELDDSWGSNNFCKRTQIIDAC